MYTLAYTDTVSGSTHRALRQGDVPHDGDIGVETRTGTPVQQRADCTSQIQVKLSSL